MWFDDHFEASDDEKVDIIDICLIFKHTTGHDATCDEILKTLRRNCIEIKECFKMAKEHWTIPFRCKTHRVLGIGLSDVDEIRTEYVTMIHSRDSGTLTIDIVREHLSKIGKIRDDQKDRLKFKTLCLNDDVDIISDRERSIFVKQKMRKQFVLIDE